MPKAAKLCCSFAAFGTFRQYGATATVKAGKLTVHRAPCGGGRAFGAWLLLHPWCDGCRCCGGVRAHVSGKSCLCCPGLPAARTGSVEARHRPVIGGDGERQLAAKSRTFR